MSVTIPMAWSDAADPDLGLPKYATAGAAGADLRVNFPPAQRALGIWIQPQAIQSLPTGLRFEIPAGYEVQLRPRSGLALKQGLTLPNSPATIDADYRGQVMVILQNLGAKPVHIRHGDRIAQMIVAPVIQVTFQVVEILSQTKRGTGGHGSTGRA
ncbi:dUTP diphosphatase [Actibacterium sp. 188UL27-1]|uniref:dUTP diphosphatase n=1 Tax=Actibacterium sp. 188UL27-1 TaxID=2786961 RepID=UPI00195B1455|nr:dUTP diphosphatase [Actibacterium sp. 188UL27-1]MBM7068113.1 dUTP diphosphatase [Actibacterium sp. 188UL27-1]